MSETASVTEQDSGREGWICGVSRANGLVRGFLLAVGGVLLILPVVYVWPTLHFAPSPGWNRLTDYSRAIVVVIPAMVGVLVLVQAARWLALAAWPAALGFYAGEDALTLYLGPFGRHRLDWPRMKIAYSFDLGDDEEMDPDLLALDEEEEMQTFLPRIHHPAIHGNARFLIKRFADVDEPRLAVRLRPFFERIRVS